MGNNQWHSFEEQLKLLKSRGLAVENTTVALTYLERIGYYRLSGYWYPFRKMKTQPAGHSYREDEFIEGSRFEEAVELYVFDKKLRLLALDALERIEMAVRVDVAHLLGRYNAFSYYDVKFFDRNFTTRSIRKKDGATGFQIWHERFNSLQYRARKNPFVEHNLEKYGRLQIWVAIEILDFGSISQLYAGLKYQDRSIIAAKYKMKENDFKSLLKSLNYIRNVSAHHSRLWNINVVEFASSFQLDSNWQQVSGSRAFYYFCGMQYLLNTICPQSTWKERFKEHLSSFPKVTVCTASLEDFGITNNIEMWELWKL